MPYLPFLPPRHLQRPPKLSGSASISGTPSDKSGVGMSTPVHLVATPLDGKRCACLETLNIIRNLIGSQWNGSEGVTTSNRHTSRMLIIVTANQGNTCFVFKSYSAAPLAVKTPSTAGNCRISGSSTSNTSATVNNLCARNDLR